MMRNCGLGRVSRRKLLRGLAGIGAGLTYSQSIRAVQAQAPKTLKLGYICRATLLQLGAGATVFANEVAKRTNGRFQIEQYPNSAWAVRWKCSKPFNWALSI